MTGLGQASLSWAGLPFWQGLQDRPGVARCLPLTLTVQPDGFLAQCGPGSTLAEVVANYADAGYGFITPPPGTSAWGTALGEDKLRTLERFAGALDGLRMLEIGGANLFLAGSLRRKYAVARYVAVDPALRRWPEDVEVEALRAYFPCPDLAGETFDLVLAHNCLEHVPDPPGFLAAIRAALAPGGRAFLTFPDVARQFADGDLNAVLHEHLIYLDEPSARALFARCGLGVARWESGADLASCLLVRAEPAEGTEPVGTAAALLAQGIHGFGIHLPQAVAALERDLTAGRRIAFYGATNGLNGLLGITGLGREVPVLDGDRAKHGRFLPASSRAIRWVGAAEAEPASFERIYVTAGSFQPAIVRALTETHGVQRQRIAGLFRRE